MSIFESEKSRPINFSASVTVSRVILLVLVWLKVLAETKRQIVNRIADGRIDEFGLRWDRTDFSFAQVECGNVGGARDCGINVKAHSTTGPFVFSHEQTF